MSSVTAAHSLQADMADCIETMRSPHRIKMSKLSTVGEDAENNKNLARENHQPAKSFSPIQFVKKSAGRPKHTGRRVIDKVVAKNRKVTEYFPVRRSVRKCTKFVLEEKQKDLINKILGSVEDGLEVRHFVGKGRGIVTTRSFSKGEFVVEYAGDLIDIADAKKREIMYAKDQTAGCYMYYFHHLTQQYCVDATPESNRLGRLLNHSRNGNLVPKVVEIDTKPHLVLLAKDDISAGTELCYDYGDRSRESVRNHPWLLL